MNVSSVCEHIPSHGLTQNCSTRLPSLYNGLYGHWLLLSIIPEIPFSVSFVIEFGSVGLFLHGIVMRRQLPIVTGYKRSVTSAVVS